MAEYGVTIMEVNPTPTDSVAALHNLTAKDAAGWTQAFGWPAKASSGVSVSPRSALGFPPLWRALNVISDDVAGIPCNVFKRDTEKMGRDVANDHAAEKLLRGANTTVNPQRVMKTVTAHAMLYGNGFAVIDRDTRKNPIDIAVLDPRTTSIAIMPSGVWYVPMLDGEPVRLPARDVIHIRGLCNDGITGLSVIELMKDALGVGMAAMQFGARFFGQGSNAGGILMIPGTFSEEKIRNTMAAWDKMTQGLQRAHKVALLQEGAKFQQLTIQPDHAQFLETRQFEIRGTISNIFGIPPHMLGDDSRTSHNSLEQEDQNYLTRSLNPWLKEWERELTEKLLSTRERAQGTHFVEFNREALIQMSFQDKINGLAKQLEVGLVNHNEARRMLNFPDLGPDGERRFRPANWLELGAEQGANNMQTDGNQQAKAAPMNILKAMIASTVTDSLTIERDRVVMAARNPDVFLESAGRFYQEWAPKIHKKLGWKTTESVVALQAHVDESLRHLQDVAAVSTSGNLEAAVRDVVACWHDRSGSLIEKIIEAAK